MWILSSLALVFISLYGCCAADSSDSAHLLVSKRVLNEFVVEGRDLTVSYAIYNVGSSPATSVSLVEETFSSDDFEIVNGQLSVRWQSIAPGANVSHNLILKPLRSGVFNITSAMVTYQPKEDADQQVVYSTAFGEAFVMDSKTFNRRHAPHVLDWGIFGLMTVPTIFLPYAIWYSTHSKYDGSKSKKL
ncbi:translocon-associated protein subunit beta-like [Dendronephthya gigantea]|uniref:translocon-associated protein subunit beta-like n=1 Tax=Dendronephthya gigantea TaxID=151771 RepID=UPI00106B9BE8|nr:translocon-associated protein subunit beta-like [Dendronephthya gigantea]XP_028416485.1 translocon-associated protein subunit beta-like [Dendronephthya gigantea]